ncbi:MAG TPA: nitrate reductase [Erwinia persicina]|nr:nitrate reductase [Erwinia persicina]
MGIKCRIVGDHRHPAGKELVLFPLLSVALVGTYGFAVWFLQMLFGPPGPPN